MTSNNQHTDCINQVLLNITNSIKRKVYREVSNLKKNYL